MKKIPNSLVPVAYQIAKKVYEKKLSLKEAKKELSANNQMNENSAADYINNFKCMLKGKKFTRTLNAFSMDFFLTKIKAEYGEEEYGNSLKALNLHIEYYENKQNTTMRKTRKILEKHSKLNEGLIHFIYQLLQKIRKENFSSVDAQKELNEEFEGTKTKISDYEVYFNGLILGQLFKRKIKADHLEKLIELIHDDFGLDGLISSIRSLELYNSHYGNQSGLFVTILENNNQILSNYKEADFDSFEQTQIDKRLKDGKISKEALYQELELISDISEEKITFSGKRYKRINKAIAIIKYLRPRKCQIPNCGISIIKKNGEAYVEAAHVIPKWKKGKETWDNILLLCPNHHKEFDLGDTDVINSDGNMVEFTMNGHLYEISLKPDFA